MPGFICEQFHTLVIESKQDVDGMWKSISVKSCRYAINPAVREGIQVRLNHNVGTCYELHRVWWQKKGLPIDSMDLDTMLKYGTSFSAELNGEITGGQLYLGDENPIGWHVGASKLFEGDKDITPFIGAGNRLIIWEAIK